MIEIIISGGTFDKVYFPITGTLGFNQEEGGSVIPQLLSQARLNLKVDTRQLKLIDSLEMDDSYREGILAACQDSQADRIIITHGTDTMAITAQFLLDANLTKTIVLTGAMVPFLVDKSDAFFNLGFAFSCVQLLPPGVFIAINGEVFAAGQVVKNTTLGRFERISSH